MQSGALVSLLCYRYRQLAFLVCYFACVSSDPLFGRERARLPHNQHPPPPLDSRCLPSSLSRALFAIWRTLLLSRSLACALPLTLTLALSLWPSQSDARACVWTTSQSTHTFVRFRFCCRCRAVCLSVSHPLILSFTHTHKLTLYLTLAHTLSPFHCL